MFGEGLNGRLNDKNTILDWRHLYTPTNGWNRSTNSLSRKSDLRSQISKSLRNLTVFGRFRRQCNIGGRTPRSNLVQM
nr:MAG TPA: hypothetical protein [Caudoviricetes sp.]